MAAKPRDLVVRFLSDVQGFLRGTDDMADALDDTARDLDRVADKGDASARQLAQAFDRAGDSMKRDMRDASRKSQDAISETGKEAGQEFASNLGEAISSGDVSGTLAGTVGGLAATMGATGPIGLGLAGLGALAAGVWGAMSKGAEDAANAAQLAFDQLHDNTTREARLNAVLTDRFGSSVKGWEQIQRYADASGISVEKIAAALVNGGPEARSMAERFEAIMKHAYDTTGQLDASTSILIDGQDDLNDRATAMERAAAAAKTERDALRESEGILRRSATYYAARGSAYAAGGSTTNSQLGAAAPYVTGTR
jgi:hypothetical protein